MLKSEVITKEIIPQKLSPAKNSPKNTAGLGFQNNLFTQERKAAKLKAETLKRIAEERPDLPYQAAKVRGNLVIGVFLGQFTFLDGERFERLGADLPASPALLEAMARKLACIKPLQPKHFEAALSELATQVEVA